jgi:hypothetical protein
MKDNSPENFTFVQMNQNKQTFTLLKMFQQSLKSVSLSAETEQVNKNLAFISSFS